MRSAIELLKGRANSDAVGGRQSIVHPTRLVHYLLWPIAAVGRPGDPGGMTWRLPRWSIAIASLTLLPTGCTGGDDNASPSQTAIDDSSSSAVPQPETTQTPDTDVTTVSSVEPDTDTDKETTGQACALLDDAYLNAALAGQTGTFGDPYQFLTGSGSADGLTCSWQDAATGLTLRITLEDAASAQTADHTGRAYNIDVDPVVEPQDGPGEQAVLLIDPAFGDLGGDGFPYGYFFVAGAMTVFVESVGLDVGADALEEAGRRSRFPSLGQLTLITCLDVTRARTERQTTSRHRHSEPEQHEIVPNYLVALASSLHELFYPWTRRCSRSHCPPAQFEP